MENDVTDKQLQLMAHAMGINGQNTVSHRNYFAASPGSADDIEWQTLVRNGFALCHGKKADVYGDLVFYTVSERGEPHARRWACDQKPRYTRSQKRYQEFLDADGSETFGEFLKRKSRSDTQARI